MLRVVAVGCCCWWVCVLTYILDCGYDYYCYATLPICFFFFSLSRTQKEKTFWPPFMLRYFVKMSMMMTTFHPWLPSLLLCSIPPLRKAQYTHRWYNRQPQWLGLSAFLSTLFHPYSWYLWRLCQGYLHWTVTESWTRGGKGRKRMINQSIRSIRSAGGAHFVGGMVERKREKSSLPGILSRKGCLTWHDSRWTQTQFCLEGSIGNELWRWDDPSMHPWTGWMSYIYIRIEKVRD